MQFIKAGNVKQITLPDTLQPNFRKIKLAKNYLAAILRMDPQKHKILHQFRILYLFFSCIRQLIQKQRSVKQA